MTDGSAKVTILVSYSTVTLVDETPSMTTVEFNPLLEAKTVLASNP